LSRRACITTPAPAEIRQQAFEIHIARDGIHGCDPDDWLQAERELQESSKTKKEEQQKGDMRYRNDIEIRERSATMESPSLLGRYHILGVRHPWTVFQAIRHVLWLAR
jgi:hypothetical protein